MNMDLGLCDSFDEEDIQNLQAQLEDIQGPSLKDLQILQEEQPIVSLNSIHNIKTILDGQGKDIKLVGNDSQAQFKAFFYVLLLIGAEERRNYPHLNTLIRQQFYKPNIFKQNSPSQSNDDESRAMLQKCLQYFEQVGEGVRAEEYILRQPLFQRACLIMLKNSIQSEQSQQQSVFEQLSRKFNIDLRIIHRQMDGECYELGVNKNYHIIRQYDYYFLSVCQSKDDLNQSKLQMQSIRSGESGLHLIAPQASDQSTPKFKNSEVKYRKKSHKNSFGGDLDIVQYRDLLHLQTQKISNNNAKVLSQYFDLNEVESCAQNLQDKALKKHSFQDIIDSQKIEMKGSTTLQSNNVSHLQRRKDRKISSSQIIEYRDFYNFQKKEENSNQVGEQLHQEQEDDNSAKLTYNSLVVVKDQPNPLIPRIRTSFIQQKELERIQEHQSSQKQSTHPDHQSQLSEQRIEMPDNQSQVKMKDRKYSYFTQQMASNKSKKLKEIQSSNYVFRIPKNIHKNSQVILPNGEQHQIIRKRFQQNPLRFSQLGGQSECSNQESYQQTKKRTLQRNIKLSSEVYSYQVKFEPNNWYKKEVIYHLDNGQKEVQIFQRTFARPHPQPHPQIQLTQYKLAQLKQQYSPRLVLKQQKSSVQLSQQRALIRESLDSAKTLPYNLRIKQQNNFQAKQKVPSINPYQLNQTSFLKNRIQSMANLDPIYFDNQDSKSNAFSTCRSLKNIASPTKINFNYLTSQRSNESITSSTKKVNIAPQTIEPLQFRRTSVKPSLSPPPTVIRPQTFNGFNGLLNGPGPATEIRFIRR